MRAQRVPGSRDGTMLWRVVELELIIACYVGCTSVGVLHDAVVERQNQHLCSTFEPCFARFVERLQIRDFIRPRFKIDIDLAIQGCNKRGRSRRMLELQCTASHEDLPILSSTCGVRRGCLSNCLVCLWWGWVRRGRAIRWCLNLAVYNLRGRMVLRLAVAHGVISRKGISIVKSFNRVTSYPLPDLLTAEGEIGMMLMPNLSFRDTTQPDGAAPGGAMIEVTP